MSGGARRPQVEDGDLTLTVNGRSIAGWTSVRVTRGVERFPSSFQIEMTDRDPGTPVNEGNSCEVRIGGDLLVTGFIDVVDRAFDERGNVVSVTGRSKSQDLIDCSAEWPTCQITSSTALAIAQKIAAPYGIKVAGVGDPGRVIPTFNFALGETGADIIERTLRYTGKLLLDKPDGSVLITDVGTAKAASGFTEGQNIQSARITSRVDQRYSVYKIFMVAMDAFEDVGDGGNLIKTVNDPNVRPQRLKYFVAESGDSSFEVAKKRILWEAARRKGRGQTVRIVTDRWRDKAGKLWEPNTLAPVKIPAVKLASAELLIAEVTYRRDAERGTTAELTLMAPDAFRPAPIILQPAVNLTEVKRN
ncbi:MAG: hypothetical protein KBA31_00125 [Alphaproteobacteria bacterium]|nr:hypothetical protein [Alphaproteobacteria bacterium]